MARKNDAFYFDSFDRSAEYACQAVQLLADVMRHYDPDTLQERMGQMHAIEQAADEVRHALVDELVTAFITPIDREDIALLSDYLDSVVDEIEGVLHRLYYDNVREIRPDALVTLDKVVEEVGQMKDLVAEMRRFKRVQDPARARVHDQPHRAGGGYDVRGCVAHAAHRRDRPAVRVRLA